MKFLHTLIGCCLLSTVGYSQVQIRSLQEASDKSQRQFDQARILPPTFDKLEYVNPFIGTGGHGHTYPGASAPFGMMQLSPDTRYDGWDGCSGYHYSDSVIYGFSHTHLSGTGVSDYGDLLIVPQVGSPKIDAGYASEKGYGAHFSHENETASPGFYAVHLDEPDIDVRLAASTRAGIHEYTFNKTSGKKFILIDLDYRDKLLSSDLVVEGSNTVYGHRTSQAWATRQEFHFYMQTDVPFQKARHIQKDGRHKLLLIFPKNTEKIVLRVGISAVDKDGAKANLEQEITGFDLELAKLKTQGLWRRELDKIMFETDDKEVMFNFYTALYHSYLNPNVFSDVDRRYRGYDGNIYTLPEDGSANYTVFSLWDTYRATHPLFTLTQEKRTNDFINTFLRQYEQGGTLPIWELAGNETGCMIGYHSVSVIADAYTKGIRGFDARKAINAMVATSNRDELGKREFRSNGFLGVSNEPESVSKTLEYSYDDFCIAQMIWAYRKAENNFEFDDLHKDYLKSSMNFINVYDPSTKFMRGRRSLNWFAPFKPAEVNFNYTEANSWQYSLYTPHAIGVHTNLLGGKDSLELWLDRLFSTPSELSGRHQVDITGLIGQYAHGNEPSHHMAYLYNYTNAPEKTALYVDSILQEMYSNAPDGLSGNEDCGQMSSWYVLSALGLYQVAPGNPFYDFGRPLLDKGMLQMENGKILHIKTNKQSKTSKYIDKIVFNGTELQQRFISHQTLKSGGKLEYFLVDKPSKNYASYATAPSIDKIPEEFVSAPYRLETERIFDKETLVTLATQLPGQQIYYTLDGTNPKTSKSRELYLTEEAFFESVKGIENQPINVPQFGVEIEESTEIKAYCEDSSGNASAVVSARLIKKDPGVHIKIHSEYANQYAAYGDLTMIDGIRGSKEYRTGDWQGYWAQNLVVEVAFDQPRPLKKIGLGCLEDTKSWIFLPSAVIVEGSTDGVTYDVLGLNKLIHTAKEIEPANIVDFWIQPENAGPYKKIRISAMNYGKCPDWHLGAGSDTWLFVDEILFE